MMLSPQAARMGTVYTTLRNIGMSSSPLRKGSALVSGARRLLAPTVSMHGSSSWGVVPILSSHFSTRSSYEDTEEEEEEEEIVNRSFGHTAGIDARHHSPHHTHEEPWMINLGREDDAWLHGPRAADSWFTGLPPKDCPGVDKWGR